MQREEFLFSKELVAILSQLYVLRMLKFLEGFGELGEKIQIDFRRAMEAKTELDPSITMDFALQKEILDNIILKHGALKQILKDKQGAEIVENFTTPLNKIRAKSFDTITENVKKAEKEEKKETKTTTPVVKKKGGSSASVTKPSPKIDVSKLFKNEYHPGSQPTRINPIPVFITPNRQETPVQEAPTNPVPPMQPVPPTPPQPENVGTEEDVAQQSEIADLMRDLGVATTETQQATQLGIGEERTTTKTLDSTPNVTDAQRLNGLNK